MSKDIWHTADEKPMLHRSIILCGDGWSMPFNVYPDNINHICWKNIEKWCYLEDLVALETELDRTHKVLSDTIKLSEEMLVDIEYEGLCSWEYEDRLKKIKEQKDK